MSVLEFDDIRRAYKKGEQVLDGVSFAVERGEVVGLLGKNGAGKTTLLRIAMGMIEAQQGTVRVFGADPHEEPVEVKRRIGYVSEDQILPPFLRVRDVIDLHRNLFPTWDAALERELSERFRIPWNTKVKSLSKGQARQVALLCAVAHRPELLILDEPAGGLDPAARREFLETSIQLLNETGSTILFSSHHMGDVERMASRLIMIHETEKWIDSELDAIRDGYCLAMVPADAASPEDLLALGDCLCVRRRGQALHAVFAVAPAACRASVERSLGRPGVQCRPLPLEDMFIELVGRDA